MGGKRPLGSLYREWAKGRRGSNTLLNEVEKERKRCKREQNFSSMGREEGDAKIASCAEAARVYNAKSGGNL